VIAVSIETRLFINGEFVESENTFPIYAPFDESLVCNVHEARQAEVDRAVAAAKAAFPAWEALQATGRKPYLIKLAGLLREASDELGMLESFQLGCPVEKGLGDIAADEFELCANLAIHITGTSMQNNPGTLGVEIRQPWGVCGAIIPWNAPVQLLAFKMAPCIAAGNTLVLKSSEKSPLSPCRIAGLVKKAGIPPGVVNIISGFGVPCGEPIAAHPDIRKLSFTGSSFTGKRVQKVAAETNLKMVTLELGGKSPSIVFADADLDNAAQKLTTSVLNRGGQTCFANTRILVEESIADQFIERYKKIFDAVAKPLLDPFNEKSTGLQPVIDKIQFDRVHGFLELGKKENPEALLRGGKRMGEKGFFFEPTIFLNIPVQSRLWKEEIFGPCSCIRTFKTEAEALQEANNTEFGLFASVFTTNMSRAIRVGKALEAGLVGMNTATPDLGVSGMPFGGYKSSGQGREMGRAGLEQYYEQKSLFIRFSETEEN
jgi:aldehyde dehydrogenase (NAD+)